MIGRTSVRTGGAVLGVLLATWSLACSSGHRFEQADANTRVTLIAPSYPLTVGRNELRLEVAGRAGDRVGDATVHVRYGLPAMPGMGPVSEQVTLSRDGDGYVFGLDVHTRARWTIEVLVRRRGVRDGAFSFVVDVL